MKDPSRNSDTIASVKTIFRRKSGVRKIRPMALNKICLLGTSLGAFA